jgi:hypothetical protein
MSEHRARGSARSAVRQTPPSVAGEQPRAGRTSTRAIRRRAIPWFNVWFDTSPRQRRRGEWWGSEPAQDMVGVITGHPRSSGPHAQEPTIHSDGRYKRRDSWLAGICCQIEKEALIGGKEGSCHRRCSVPVRPDLHHHLVTLCVKVYR